MSGFLRELLKPDFGATIAAFKRGELRSPYAIEKAGTELLPRKFAAIWEPPIERPKGPTLFERFTLERAAA